MKFSRLLATGKSLIGVRDTDSPYRMRKGTMLPKFEPVKNPFISPPRPEAQAVNRGGDEAIVRMAPVASYAATLAVAPLQTSLLFEEAAKATPLPARQAPIDAEAGAGMEFASSDAKSEISNEEPQATNLKTARLVEVHSFEEVARMEPILHAPKSVAMEPLIARTRSGLGKKEPQAVREDGATGAASQPVKPGAVVGLVDGSPLGLKTGVAAKSGQPAPTPVTRPENKSNFLAAIIKKLNPLAYMSKRKTEGARMRAWQIRGVVQAELSLENVRVVRNELTDSDIEVIPTRPAGAVSRLQAVAGGGSATLGRLTSRFFGHDQTANMLK